MPLLRASAPCGRQIGTVGPLSFAGSVAGTSPNRQLSTAFAAPTNFKCMVFHIDEKPICSSSWRHQWHRATRSTSHHNKNQWLLL